MRLYVLFAVFFAGLCLVGCRTYVIDSNPQGLRVAVDDLERGVTPCEVTVQMDTYHRVTVEPPTNRQLRAYERKNGIVVSTWLNGTQAKTIRDDSPSGRMFFEFITSEYDRPTTEEGWVQLKRDLEHDAKELDRKRQDVLKIELPEIK